MGIEVKNMADSKGSDGGGFGAGDARSGEGNLRDVATEHIGERGEAGPLRLVLASRPCVGRSGLDPARRGDVRGLEVEGGHAAREKGGERC